MAWRTSTTFASVITVAPFASHRFSTVSHSWPGPYFGYQNSSISEVSTSLELRFFGSSLENAFASTPSTLSPLTRCAPQSAEICEGWRPHSFSV